MIQSSLYSCFVSAYDAIGIYPTVLNHGIGNTVWFVWFLRAQHHSGNLVRQNSHMSCKSTLPYQGRCPEATGPPADLKEAIAVLWPGYSIVVIHSRQPCTYRICMYPEKLQRKHCPCGGNMYRSRAVRQCVPCSQSKLGMGYVFYGICGIRCRL